MNKEIILAWIREFLKKEAIKKILGVSVKGVRYFLFITAFNFIWKKHIGPGFRFVFRKINKYFRDIRYKKKAEELNNAKTDEQFDSSVDNLP